MAGDVRRPAHGVISQEMGIEVHPHDPAPVRQGPDHLVGEVPGVVPEGPAAGVAGQEGPPGCPAEVPEAVIPQMGHVGEDMEPLHLRQKFKAPVREPAPLAVGKAQLVGVVPGEGHQPDPQGVEAPQQVRVSPEHRPLLHGEKGPDLSPGPGLLQVGEGEDRAEEVPVGLCRLPEEVRLGQSLRQGVRRPLFVHKEGEGLEKIAAVLQLFQGKMPPGSGPEGVVPARPAVRQQAGEGVAVEVDEGHGAVPPYDFSLAFYVGFWYDVPENKICGSAQGSDPLSACMGVTAPTQRLPPHRIGRLYRLPGPFASISHLSVFAVDGVFVVSVRLCAAGPGDAYRIFLLMLCRVIPTRHFLFFPIRLEARRGSLAGLLGENKIFQEEES